MEMRQLGHSGLHVSALGFGAMTFGADGVLQAIGQTLEKEAERQVGLCLDAGVTLFDTAEGYSAGRSEEILAHALGKRRHEAIIATKAWNGTGTGPNAIGASRLHILQACDESLRRLRTDYIDLYQIHCWDALVPLEETVRALDDLVRAGKVRYIGCSNYAGWQLTKALGLSDRHGLARFVSNQIYYSLAGRDAEHEIVPAALDQGVGLLLWGPLAFGLLTGKFRRGQPDPEGARGSLMGAPGGGIERARLDDLTDAIADIAAARGVTASQIAINYLRRKPAVSCVMFGARNEAQLRDNLAAAQWSLSDEEFTRLDTLSAPRPYAPAWIQRYIFGSRNP